MTDDELIRRLRSGYEHTPGEKTCSRVRWDAADRLEELTRRMTSYLIINHGRSIVCLRCSFTSRNMNDVHNHFCAWCCMWHDDPLRLEGPFLLPSASGDSSEKFGGGGSPGKVAPALADRK